MAMVLQGKFNKMHMNFNINRYSTIHIGRHNIRNRYTLKWADIGKSNLEKNLSEVSQNLRPREQYIIARNRANKVLDFIAMSVRNIWADAIIRLYLALIRPHLDYAVQFRFLYYKINIVKLEAAQWGMSKYDSKGKGPNIQG